MSTEPKVPSSAEAWESGSLGRDEKYARKAPSHETSKIDEALGLQAISIRLPKAVIETYKMLANMHGVGYQPLMRDALCRFAEGEMKQLLLGAVESQRQHASRRGKPTKPATPLAPRKGLKKAA